MQTTELNTIRIGAKSIGPGQPAFLIAELSANHNGSLERALATIRAAAAAGADAIKIQTYTADTITIKSDRPEFTIKTGPWAGKTLYDLYDEAHTPWDWHAALFAEARKSGIEVFSTPFDASAIELLEDLGAPAYKIASFELVDDALIRAAAVTGKPVIMSTGMASIEEIAHAVTVFRDTGASELVLLRCTSSYPAPDDTMNLLTIQTLAREFDCLVGLSDHSLGTTAPVVAVSLGASVVEKHFTLSRGDGGVDSRFSLEPAEFRELVRDVRRAEAMVGASRFGPGLEEGGSLAIRRSLYVVEDVRTGETLSHANVRSIRPGLGLSPRHMEAVIGRRAAEDIPRGTPLSWDVLAPP